MDFKLATQALELASDPQLSAGCDKKYREVAIWFTLDDGNQIAARGTACCLADAHYKAYFEFMPQILDEGFKISSIGIKFIAKS